MLICRNAEGVHGKSKFGTPALGSTAMDCVRKKAVLAEAVNVTELEGAYKKNVESAQKVGI